MTVSIVVLITAKQAENEQTTQYTAVNAKAIIDKYRKTAAPVVAFWDMCGELIERSLYKGKEYNHKGVLLFRKPSAPA